MRNALVLVPLCIGLISGFIVPTTTTEVNENEQTLPTKSLVNISNERVELKKKLVESAAVPLHNINEDEEELYSQGSEDKNINERSLVLVNHGWKKLPYKSNLDEAMKSSLLIPYEDAIKNSQNNLSVKQQNMKENGNKNVNYVTLIHQLHNRPLPNDKGNREYNLKNKDSNHVNIMKSVVLTSSNNDKRNQSLEYVTRKSYLPVYNNIQNANNKYFNDLSKVTNDSKVNNKNGEKIRDEGSENDLLFKENIYDLQDNFDIDSMGDHKIFQLTSEEQAREKQSLQNNNEANLNSFKCCQQCKANIRKLNRHMEMECKCKCGRYIRLRGPADVENKRWKAFIQLPKGTKKI